MKKYITLAALAALSLGNAAHAGQKWPTSVVGNWTAVANQSPLTISIATEASTGKCRQITGTITDNNTGGVDNLLGYYCPNSGRFAFTRAAASNDVTYQTYSGNVSDTGSSLYMGGTFNELATASSVGEYAFLASH